MRVSLALVALLCTIGVARAEQLDLSTMTCAQFMKSDDDAIILTLAWLDAYYKTDEDPPVIDTDKFERNAKKLGEYCAANPNIGLITATDKLFE